MTYTARDVADAIEAIAPLDSGVPGDHLGFIHGRADADVRGVGCAWNVHTGSLALAVEAGLNMIVCHEALWMSGQSSPWYDGPAEADILPNRLRRDLLDRHGMIVYRAHSNWDALPADGVADRAVTALGIDGLGMVERQKFFQVNRLPQPMTVAALADLVGRALGFDRCRIFCDAGQSVTRFAVLIGGFGENQLHMPQAAIQMGAEALILGEMSEFIVIAALEMGVPVIETLHSVSESPAIRRQAEMLAERLPGLPVQYLPSGATAF